MKCPDPGCDGFAMATAIEIRDWLEVEILCADCGKRWTTDVDIRDFNLEEEQEERRNAHHQLRLDDPCPTRAP